jgi:aerobic-type carbon monoxide dehydrogenase small subunit (CoxS/CutS family)
MPTVDELTVNGTRHRVDADADRSLLSVLRDVLDLTGTKYGCGEGSCGACTVLLDGRPVRSCTSKVDAAAGRSITTIEGLADGDTLHPVQQAFLDCDALQCGYCTPGMIVAASALLDRDPDPSDARIASVMQGHLCRCGTYPRILSAIRRASDAMKGGDR